MKVKGAWAVVGLFIALCGSACGSLLFNGIPRGPGGPGGVSTIFTTINRSLGPQGPRLVTTRSGSGNATLGPFTVHGTLRVRGSCSGSGPLSVGVYFPSRGGEGTGDMCPSPLHLYLGVYRGHPKIKVWAPASVHWSVRILEGR